MTDFFYVFCLYYNTKSLLVWHFGLQTVILTDTRILEIHEFSCYVIYVVCFAFFYLKTNWNNHLQKALHYLKCAQKNDFNPIVPSTKMLNIFRLKSFDDCVGSSWTIPEKCRIKKITKSGKLKRPLSWLS